MTSLILIDGEIGAGFFGVGNSLETIKNQIDANADEVEVHINSVGGDVREGFAIHGYLKSLGKSVTTVVIGKCYSIATIILLAGEKRLMQPNAELMIHNPWGMIQGDADEIKKYAAWVQKQEDEILNFYVEKTGKPKDKIRKMMDEQTFMNFDQAKDNGFITGQVEEMRAVALLNSNYTNMKEFTPEQKQELKGMFEKFGDKIAGLFSRSVKNMLIETTDGKLFIESEDKELTGKNIFSTNDKGEKADPVKDGDITLSDGRTVTVKAGKVEKIQAKVDEAKALKDRIAELEAQIKEKSEKATEKEAEVETAKAKVIEVQAQFNDLRKIVLGEDPPKLPKPRTDPEGIEDDPMIKWYQKIVK
jgi:ATP-dependent Clp endopeptidase proteolytic subunit ClpP